MEYYLIEQQDCCKLAHRYLITESDSAFTTDSTNDWVGEFEEDTASCQAFFLC